MTNTKFYTLRGRSSSIDSRPKALDEAFVALKITSDVHKWCIRASRLQDFARAWLMQQENPQLLNKTHYEALVKYVERLEKRTGTRWAILSVYRCKGCERAHLASWTGESRRVFRRFHRRWSKA